MSETHPSAATHRVIAEAARRILRPLVRLLLRNGVTYQAFAETVKHVFVEVAAEDFRIANRKQSDSRISVITGLSRKEVKRVSARAPAEESADYVRHNRAARVIDGWNADAEFRDRSGPRELAVESGGSGSFTELVRRYSGDAPPRAVLDELERVGAVERRSDGRLRLKVAVYAPHTDDADRIVAMGVAVGDLLETADRNLCAGREVLLQRQIVSTSVPGSSVDGFRNVTRTHAEALLAEAGRWLAGHEVAREGVAAPVARTGIGIYYVEG